MLRRPAFRSVASHSTTAEGDTSARSVNRHPSRTACTWRHVCRACFTVLPLASRKRRKSARCSSRDRLRWTSKGPISPTDPSRASVASLASICLLAVLSEQSGTRRTLPSAALYLPYQISDLPLETLTAPGVFLVTR